LKRIYLDWNATAPPHPDVLAAMMDAFENQWANPSSVHGDGRAARSRVEDARAKVALLTGIDPRDVLLTGGGTEANNLALRSAFAGGQGTLITSRLEHPSVVRVAEALEAEGQAKVRWLRVLPAGTIDVEDLARALREEDAVRLVALQQVNHETGVLQPVARARELCADVWLHVDAVQGWGRVADDGMACGPRETRSLAAHKIRGPKGIGALLSRQNVRLTPVLRGGAQERGIRPGTLDPVAAAGLAVAAERARSAPERYRACAGLRDRLERGLLEIDGGARVNGGEAERAPHVTNIAFSRWRGPELVAALDLEGISVSSGSACSAGTMEPSNVIVAMHGLERAEGSVRFSLGETTTANEVEQALAIAARVLARVFA
jgi:cysteine desulfurase